MVLIRLQLEATWLKKSLLQLIYEQNDPNPVRSQRKSRKAAAAVASSPDLPAPGLPSSASLMSFMAASGFLSFLHLQSVVGGAGEPLTEPSDSAGREREGGEKLGRVRECVLLFSLSFTPSYVPHPTTTTTTLLYISLLSSSPDLTPPFAPCGEFAQGSHPTEAVVQLAHLL